MIKQPFDILAHRKNSHNSRTFIKYFLDRISSYFDNSNESNTFDKKKIRKKVFVVPNCSVAYYIFDPELHLIIYLNQYTLFTPVSCVISLFRNPENYYSHVHYDTHDDVIKWKHFPRYWPFVRGITNSPHKGQWRGTLMFSLICTWINGWVINREAGDLRRHRAHYDVTVMPLWIYKTHSCEDGVISKIERHVTAEINFSTKPCIDKERCCLIRSRLICWGLHTYIQCWLSCSIHQQALETRSPSTITWN